MYWIQFLGFVLPYVKVAIACWLKKKTLFCKAKRRGLQKHHSTQKSASATDVCTVC